MTKKPEFFDQKNKSDKIFSNKCCFLTKNDKNENPPVPTISILRGLLYKCLVLKKQYGRQVPTYPPEKCPTFRRNPS